MVKFQKHPEREREREREEKQRENKVFNYFFEKKMAKMAKMEKKNKMKKNALLAGHRAGVPCCPGSTVRLHRLCRVVSQECGPKENTVSLAIGQFLMTGSQRQPLDAEKRIEESFVG